MTGSLKLILLLAAAAVLLAGCGAKDVTSSKDPKLLFETKCSRCHGYSQVLAQRHTRAGWTEWVKWCSAQWKWSIKSREQKVIIDYLVNIRPAESDDPGQMPKPADPDNLKDTDVPFSIEKLIRGE